MTTRIDTHTVETHLAEYLERASCQGERLLVEREGQPAAALVRQADLERLEAWDAAEHDPARQAVLRRALADLGVRVTWPSGPPLPPSHFTPLEIEGPPLSGQIIADCR